MPKLIDYSQMSFEELTREKHNIRDQMIEINTTAQTENRDLTADEQATWNNLTSAIGSITRLSEIALLERSLRLPPPAVEPGSAVRAYTEQDKNRIQYREAFYDYCLNGMNGMKSEHRKLIESRAGRLNRRQVASMFQPRNAAETRALEDYRMLSGNAALQEELQWEERALTVGTDSEGGFTVPEGFSNELMMQMRAYGGMREAARVLSTATGNDIPWPTLDDTNAVASIVGESALIPQQEMSFGQKILKAFKYTSGYVNISWELLQDSFLNFESLLAEAFAIRFARGTNAHFTSGNGTTQPEGLIGNIATINLVTNGALVYQDLVNLKFAVNPAYRPNARFMFNDGILALLVALVDADNRPLWIPSITAGESDMILGHPYTINYDMSTNLAATQPSVMLFGDFNHHIIRDVAPIRVRRLEETRALNGEVQFFAWARFDSRFVTAVIASGDTPIKGLGPSAV